MQLFNIRLRDYRCMADATVTLGKRTLLIGGNGAGKTSLVEAVDKVFGAGRRNYGFREQDLAPGTSELKVDFEIRPDHGSTFTQEEHALFGTHVDLDDRGAELAGVKARFDPVGDVRPPLVPPTRAPGGVGSDNRWRARPLLNTDPDWSARTITFLKEGASTGLEQLGV